MVVATPGVVLIWKNNCWTKTCTTYTAIQKLWLIWTTTTVAQCWLANLRLYYCIILMYYLNWISKFNWIQPRTNWSFPGDWSSCIVKPRQTAFTITQSDLLVLIKGSTTLICKSIQDVRLSHSPHVFLLLNLHCQCLSPSSVCPKDNTAVPRFSYCTGLSQANSIGLPLSSAKQAHISLLSRGKPSTENDSIVLVAVETLFYHKKDIF